MCRPIVRSQRFSNTPKRCIVAPWPFADFSSADFSSFNERVSACKSCVSLKTVQSWQSRERIASRSTVTAETGKAGKGMGKTSVKNVGDGSPNASFRNAPSFFNKPRTKANSGLRIQCHGFIFSGQIAARAGRKAVSVALLAALVLPGQTMFELSEMLGAGTSLVAHKSFLLQ